MGDASEIRGGIAEVDAPVAPLDRELATTVSLELVTDEAWHPYAVVHLKGELDLYTAPMLAQALADLSRNGEYQVVVDLEGVHFLDSTGLRVLIEARQRFQKLQGSLSVVCTRNIILRAFQITGLDHALCPHATIEEATSPVVDPFPTER